MKIRPEAKETMIAFGSPSTEPDARIREKTMTLFDAPDAFGSVEWQMMPLTALAQAYANVQG